MQYGMVIDTYRCYGCSSCAVACKLSNNLSKGVWWNELITEGGDSKDTPGGQYPENHIRYISKACQHCALPSCVAKCPTGASQKRDDGIVIVDHELCIGCGTCLTACPYQVRTLIETVPEYYQDVALGQWDAPLHEAGTVEKCTFCANLIDRDKKPACIKACVVHARIFGDLDDPESDVSKALTSGREYRRLQEEDGTEPSIYFLI